MSLRDTSTRTIQIVSGSSTTTFNGPNEFVYRFPAAGYQSGRDEVAMKALTIYNSFFNISAAKNNNTFGYIWPGEGPFTVVMADGIWSYAALNDYLHQVMVSRGQFLTDDQDTNRYYLDFQVNPITYSISLTATPLPLTLPAGWSGTVDLVAAAGNCPQLTVTAQTALLFGFSAGNYPAAAQTTLFQQNSPNVPQISDVTSFNLLCNLVDNSGFTLSPFVLATFTVPPNSAGSLIQLTPQNLDWVSVQQNQNFSDVSIRLVDQLMRPVVVYDPQGAVISLSLRKRV